MKTKLEQLGLGLILAPVIPVAGLLVGWWMAYAVLPERWIPFGMGAGLIIGVLADGFLLKRLLKRRLGWGFWAAVHIFYSMCIFGFFMGVPVVNAALALPAGFVAGCRLAAEHADPQRVRRIAWNTAWFATGVLLLVCAASAFIALTDPYTAGSLEGMLGLQFEVTQGMMVGLIVVGGVVLLAACWGLTVAAVRWTYKFLAMLV